jgi:4-hydroxy-3-polyprenylbenzoate decarboxylase
VLVIRETPLSPIHLDNLLTLARLGVVILPPVPAFYNHPETIDDLVEHLVVRVLDQFGLEVAFDRRWTGELERRAGDSED